MVAFVLPIFRSTLFAIFIDVFSFRFLYVSSGLTVPSLASGLTSDNENSPVEYFMRHHSHSYQQQQHHQQQQQHTPNSIRSSGSIKDELNDEKRGRSISPSISVDGSYACSQCSASFQSRDQLEKHEMAHSPIPAVPAVSVQIHLFHLVEKTKTQRIPEKKTMLRFIPSRATTQYSRTTLNMDENRPPPKRKCMQYARVCLCVSKR